MLRIEPVSSNEQVALVRELLREYAAEFSADPSFHNFDRELRELPGKYAPPAGRLLLAYHYNDAKSAHPSGCGALRPLSSESCEMKRLYVRPEFRAYGVGRALACALIAAAREIGYRAMRLDTLGSMHQAHKLYRHLGFQEIPAYYGEPVEGVRYLELDLSKSLSSEKVERT
jgi:ribosomal protein S18 acetylase RimI-like enzyme